MRLNETITYDRAVALGTRGGENAFPKGRLKVELVAPVGEQDTLFSGVLVGDGESWTIAGEGKPLYTNEKARLHGGWVSVGRPLTMYEALIVLCQILAGTHEAAVNAYAAYEDDCFRAATGNSL